MGGRGLSRFRELTPETDECLPEVGELPDLRRLEVDPLAVARVHTIKFRTFDIKVFTQLARVFTAVQLVSLFLHDSEYGVVSCQRQV